ncbi:hypothetical protein BsWGS_06195 [Bradybaena similaris]
MDDSFELEYADELEALDDSLIDSGPVDYVPPKSKRSLQFETPNGKNNRPTGQNLKDKNDSVELQLNASVNDDYDSPPSSPLSFPLSVEFAQNNRKRGQNILEQDELDDLNDPLRTLGFLRKRPCLEDVQENTHDNKSKRGENVQAAALIEQIQQHRHVWNVQNQLSQSQATQGGTQARLNDAEDLDRPRVHKRIPKCDFMSAVGHDGQRVYMKLWNEDVLEAEFDSVGGDARSTSLLPVPVCIMKEQLEEKQSRKILQEAEEAEERILRQIEKNAEELTANTENMEAECIMAGEDQDVNKITEDMKSLWVEKYAPKKYTELLSEESINRSLLHWMKLWDYVVFGKNVPKPMKKGGNPKEKFKEKFKGKKPQAEVMEELDKNNCPQQKVALLCGPPGLGKTTLAHIVARHAGYNAVEMNASDDRSVETFRNKIESATQMKSVVEADPRPNCLIIDEIDGAPAPAINVLLNTIKKSENDASTASKKKKNVGTLMRPIICVCNDQYVPALRQLRQMALVLNFPQTESSRLASRLYEVVREEKLKTDMNALLALCEKTDNDVRSCLNTLQFVRQKQKELTLRDIQTMSVGQKDTQKSLFSVWHEVFAMPRPKKNQFVSIQDLLEGKQENKQTTNITPQARFQHILDVCQSSGEFERVLQGLYENYLEAKSKDPHLNGLNLANEWLCFTDLTMHYTARSQDYSVMKFNSFLPVVFHFLYASYSPSRIQFPHMQTEAHQKLLKAKNLLATMITDMAPIVRKFNNPQSLVLDLLPPLLDILQPTLRPVNTQLYSSREKEELSSVVRIMIAYNMTYHQEKTPDGQYVYSLDPNVEEIVKLPGMKQRKQLTYAAKQMIAREIELEKMRRSEGTGTKQMPAQNTEKAALARKANPVVPNHLQKLEAKSLAAEKPAFNFFGNFVRTKRVQPVCEEAVMESKQEKPKKELLDTVIWFHFKEGFSNAVRRSVRVQDFL